MPGKLAAMVRAKYPGAYDDMDDTTLEKSVLAKYPQYADLAQDEPQPQAEPSMLSRASELAKNAVPILKAPQMIGGALRTMAAHPVETGAIAGGMLAVPLTGGASIPAALAAAGLGGAGGAGLGAIYGAATGNENTPQTSGDVLATMGKEGAMQAAAEGGGRLISGALAKGGRALYNRALRPATKMTEKYGDLVGAGLQEGLPVGASRTAQSRMVSSKGAADQLVAQAEAAGRTVPATAVTDKYVPLLDKAAQRESIGVGGDAAEIAAREQAFNAANPSGQISPMAAHAMKREADAMSSTAQNALHRGAASNDMTALLHDATRSGLKEGLEGIAPGLAEQNARTSQLYGLSRALRTAEQRPQALTHLASTAAGIGGLMSGDNSVDRLGRGAVGSLMLEAAMSPRAQSRAAIGLAKIAGVPAAQMIRAVLLAQMNGDDQAQRGPE